ncbi:MAG: Xaa-Pro dipeptidase [Rhodobacteraceae bacterium]|nr:Xaa-Pro dipeptidase [Paracoccaceae bacterium]MBR27749.1 Xaa-Pro dipeptidase [Paracoccaceae bacterium]
MLHFAPAEFDARADRLRAEMAARGLDALLLFAPESHYWLTGYDTFGYCFFQCLVVTPERMALVTRSADLRQAQLTSTLDDIRVWKDAAGADPSADLWAMLEGFGLSGRRLGWETDTHGLTMANGRRVEARLSGRAQLVEASDLVPALRLVKSPAEIALVREAARIADAGWARALPAIRPGAEEAEILAALQGGMFAEGGDYPANPTIIGSGELALLCRFQSGRRRLEARDQLTLEWAGVARQYHVANMRAAIVGDPRPEHLKMHAAAREALEACEAALRPGRPMAEVFDAHARVLDAHGLAAHRLNACGYSLGARFAPSWMDPQMFYEGAPAIMAENMVFFLHMILADSDSGAAMSLGRTSLIGPDGAEPLSRIPLELTVTG